MKWKDLSLKERKQIYDSVRVNNPDATYLDIKTTILIPFLRMKMVRVKL